MTTGRDELEVRLRSLFRDQADAMPVEPPDWAELCPVAVRRTLPARRVVAAAAVVAALVAVIATTTGGGDATRIRTSPADDAGAAAPTTAAPARAVFSVETRQVSLRADAVTIDAGGLTFSTAPPVQVHGDPGTRGEYTTLELTWTEHGVEMRLFFYFASDGQDWWSDEIRTYDGRSPGEWITYRGEFFRRPLGTAFVGDFDVGEQPPGTGRLRLANAHLEAFRRLPSCDDPGAALVLDPGMSPVVVPGPNGGFGLNVQLLDAASCSVVADQDRYHYAWDSADPGVVSVTTGFVPSELGGRHRDLVSVAPGQTSVRVTATDPDTGAQVAEVAVPVTVLDVPPPSAPAERPPGPPPGVTTGAGTGAGDGGPVLRSATADLGAGTITVTFDRPVVLGRAPLAAMYLVVYGDDPSCGTPDGNSHRVIGGDGTPTLTLDATSLARPTSYITLAPGFVASADLGAPSGPLGCTAVPTS